MYPKRKRQKKIDCACTVDLVHIVLLNIDLVMYGGYCNIYFLASICFFQGRRKHSAMADQFYYSLAAHAHVQKKKHSCSTADPQMLRPHQIDYQFLRLSTDPSGRQKKEKKVSSHEHFNTVLPTIIILAMLRPGCLTRLAMLPCMFHLTGSYAHQERSHTPKINFTCFFIRQIRECGLSENVALKY